MPNETPSNLEQLQKIQTLLLQQQQIQAQYDQIVATIKANPPQDETTIANIKKQLQSLNTNYLQIQAQLQALGYQAPNTTNKPAEIKSWAKANFSFKKLGIGAGGLVLLIGVLFAITINALIKNPQSLTSVAIEASVAKEIISIFAILFFGAFGLVGLGLLFSNIYRIITVKNQAKGKFIGGILLAIIILGITWALAAFTFKNINKINTTPPSNFKTPVIPYLIGKEGTKAERGSIKAIAPIEIGFELNESRFNEIIASLGEVKLQSLSINCGNEEKQVITSTNGKFEEACFYANKGDYPISLSITYTNTLTQEQNLTFEQAMASLNIPAEIQLSISSKNKKDNTKINTSQGEINIGEAPVKITLDAREMFSDLQIQEGYRILRDMDNDNTIDREVTTFDYIYKIPKVYHPTFKVPNLKQEEFIYSFPLRVKPSEVPICEVSITPFPDEKTSYKIQTNILDGNLSNIANYHFQVFQVREKQNDVLIKETTSNNRDYDVKLPEKWAFIAVVKFITIDGKQGSCESELLQLAPETLTANYSLKEKRSDEKNFKPLEASTFSEGKLQLHSIPTTLQLTVDKISPNSAGIEKNVYLDGKIILNKGDSYELLINENKNYEVKIVLEDKERWLSSTIPLNIEIQRPEIEGKLLLTPQNGYEPVKVTLNASQTILNDPEDEIIYFTYDFGDGEVKKNLTQGIITHTYTYNYEKENGVYTPKVSIITKNGKEMTFTASPNPNVLVKKQQVELEISSPSHPTSIVQINEKVQLLAEFNKLPEKMIRNFGDETPEVECKGRACYEVSHKYEKVGKYTITVTLQMEDGQSVDKTMAIKVNKK